MSATTDIQHLEFNQILDIIVGLRTSSSDDILVYSVIGLSDLGGIIFINILISYMYTSLLIIRGGEGGG